MHKNSRHATRKLIAVSFICMVSMAAGLWAEAARFGEGVDGGQAVGIGEILKDPEGFEGKEVQVRGTVTDVCPKKGCWMELRDENDAALRVKVEDDVIVFPQDAKGKTAVARGVVKLMKMDRAQYLGWMQHLAEERGETYDESNLGDGPYQIVQLTGLGAEIGR